MITLQCGDFSAKIEETREKVVGQIQQKYQTSFPVQREFSLLIHSFLSYGQFSWRGRKEKTRGHISNYSSWNQYIFGALSFCEYKLFINLIFGQIRLF